MAAEIWAGNTMVADLSKEPKEIILTIHTKTSGIDLDYEKFLYAIWKAKLDLFGKNPQ